jgi:hypothetical protein
MQTVFLAALLFLSAKILTVFLTPLVDQRTIRVVLAVYSTFAVFWQLTYIFRTLAMKRAVLTDDAVPHGLRIAMATTIVPSREFELLYAKLHGMVRVDPCGNAMDLWVLDEEDDPRVVAMIDEFNRRQPPHRPRIRHFTRMGIARYNEAASGRRFKQFQARQKGGNLNAWLDATRDERYDLITFLDLDHIPVPAFYRKVLPYFRDDDVAFVQGPESFRNREENFVSRAASFERDSFFGLVHRSYFGLAMPVIVGSHTTFRATTFDALDGHYPVHLTEDYLMMLRLRAARKQGIFVDEVLAIGDLPSTWAAYLGQQQRWASGGLDLLFRYFPRLWRSYSGKERLYTFVLLNYYAWGTFFMLAKLLLFSLLLGGLTIRLGIPLIGAVVAFSVVAMVGNYLWERQFFIEPHKRSFLLENALMNNFLGGLFLFSLVKALVAPNSAFNVTAKTRTTGGPTLDGVSYPVLATVIVGFEIVAFALAPNWFSAESAHAGHYDILPLPLIMNTIANVAVLICYARFERAPRPQRLLLLRVEPLESPLSADDDPRNFEFEWRAS